MTAVAEARALLDQLMGAERDAPLPQGAALPRKNKRHTDDGFGGGGMLLPSSKKSKSCHDPDVDPVYCAWGIDLYDLFVNTKSDLGVNPYVVDDGARNEYLSLSQEEKDKLGFEWRLFSKLQELVSHCDRIISRNNVKLEREMQRQAQKKGSAVKTDYHVKDVKDEAVEELIRTEIRLQDLKDDLERTLAKLTLLRSKEDAIMKKQQPKPVKEENMADNNGKDEDEESDPAGDDDKSKVKIKMEDDSTNIKQEGSDNTAKEEPSPEGSTVAEPNHDQADLAELGRLTLEKQALLCKIADMISRVSPTEDSIKVQLKNLNYVKSDTTTDKTVCEVSGNFMSARDADERIAAHYAGKQYVGWKLVRDKFKEMVQQHGRGGPPRPQMMDRGRGGGGGGGPLMSHQQYQQRHGGGGGGGGDRGRYGRDSRGDGKWERGGGYGRGGGGGYDRRRGGRDDGYRGGYGRR
mmetsp:Transcript_25005/g.59438  ORF Transcript_25005/g.59438 Transcript_25005/m.59438 type:complete len:463 (+) Transcript_25005:151-1539(+)